VIRVLSVPLALTVLLDPLALPELRVTQESLGLPVLPGITALMVLLDPLAPPGRRVTLALLDPPGLQAPRVALA
jgi:hypothetical protein